MNIRDRLDCSMNGLRWT